MDIQFESVLVSEVVKPDTNINVVSMRRIRLCKLFAASQANIIVRISSYVKLSRLFISTVFVNTWDGKINCGKCCRPCRLMSYKFV